MSVTHAITVKQPLDKSYSEIRTSSENIHFETATVTTMTTTGTQPPSNASWFPDVRVFPVAPREDFSGLRDHGMGGVLGTQAVQGSSQQPTLVIKVPQLNQYEAPEGRATNNSRG
ncbi:hypothetical protein QQF64_015943 [Cirrhinus molitorella]|uniref:Uncharacterized protein n=1 Tax=Cirrhinus molitorella TaxID=172907 RepID=A0ABR3LLD1_9TELE